MRKLSAIALFVVLATTFATTATAQQAVSCVDFASGTVTGQIAFSEEKVGQKTYSVLTITTGKKVIAGHVLGSGITTMKLDRREVSPEQIKQYVAGKTVTVTFNMSVPNANCGGVGKPGTYFAVSVRAASPEKKPGEITVMKAAPAPKKEEKKK